MSGERDARRTLDRVIAAMSAVADELDECDGDAWNRLGGVSLGGAVRHQLAEALDEESQTKTERVMSLALTYRSATALESLNSRTGLSHTDLANRAIQFYLLASEVTGETTAPPNCDLGPCCLNRGHDGKCAL